MRLPLRFKRGIGAKILRLVLAVSLVSLGAFAFIAITSINRLGGYAVQINESLGYYAVNSSVDALEQQAEEHLLRLAKSQAAISNALLEKVEMETDIIADYATGLWNNPADFTPRKSYSVFQNPGDIYAASVYVLAPGTRSAETEREIRLSSCMDNISISVRRNDSNVAAIYLGTQTGLARGYPWKSSFAVSYDPRKRPWYVAAAATGRIVWTEPYVSATIRKLIVTCGKPFFGRDGRLRGVVETDITMDAVNNRIINSQVGKLGYAFLIDTGGNIIARPGLNEGSTQWNQEFKTENLLASGNDSLKTIVRRMMYGQTGVGRCVFDKEDKFIAYAPISCTRWSIGIALPVHEVIAPAISTRERISSVVAQTRNYVEGQKVWSLCILLAVFVALFVLVWILATTLSKRLTKPIVDLNEGVMVVGEGNLDYHLNVKTGDEIEDLAAAFNKMTTDLKVYIENLRATTVAKERIENELQIANQIQADMLPRIFPPFPDRKEFEIFAVMKPAKEVGGDFFDFFFLEDNRLCFLIGDVSGKGVPAALFMVITKTLLRTSALQRNKTAADVLFSVNNLLCPDNDTLMFVTAFCAILNVKTGEVEYANAGHNPPLLKNGTKNYEFLSMKKNMALAVVENTPYALGHFSMNPGDMVLLYTDGVNEAMNGENKQFSNQRLLDTLNGLDQGSAATLIKTVEREIAQFVGDTPRSDDITMVGVKFFGAENR